MKFKFHKSVVNFSFIQNSVGHCLCVMKDYKRIAILTLHHNLLAGNDADMLMEIKLCLFYRYW